MHFPYKFAYKSCNCYKNLRLKIEAAQASEYISNKEHHRVVTRTMHTYRHLPFKTSD